MKKAIIPKGAEMPNCQGRKDRQELLSLRPWRSCGSFFSAHQTRKWSQNEIHQIRRSDLMNPRTFMHSSPEFQKIESRLSSSELRWKKEVLLWRTAILRQHVVLFFRISA
jgi:hypothetical protein